MFLKYLDLQDVYTTEVFEWDKFMNPMVHMSWEMFTGYSRTFRGCCLCQLQMKITAITNVSCEKIILHACPI